MRKLKVIFCNKIRNNPKYLLKYKNDFGHLVKQKFNKGKHCLIIFRKIKFREKTLYNIFYNVLILSRVVKETKFAFSIRNNTLPV